MFISSVREFDFGNRFRQRRDLLLAFICIFSGLGFSANAQHKLSASQEGQEYVAPASDEAEQAIKRFKAAAGLKVDLWAAEPLLANPVAFNFDEKGRAYVCETFRLGAGVDDIRGIMDFSSMRN